jgi:hypothetical protein
VSFGFADGQHLAFSIEIRGEKSESCSPLAGFFRAYELSFIAADERDVQGCGPTCAVRMSEFIACADDRG